MNSYVEHIIMVGPLVGHISYLNSHAIANENFVTTTSPYLRRRPETQTEAERRLSGSQLGDA